MLEKTEGRGMRFERLIWLMPLAYAAHIGEEIVGDFPGWVAAVLGVRVGFSAFLAANGLFLGILVALCSGASRSRSRFAVFALICWASGNLFWNALFHLATTLAFARYSPGLVTGLLLYLPLSLLVVAGARRSGRLGVPALAVAVVLGGALTPLVVRGGLALFGA
jgi:hypothetical protein